MAQSVYDWFRNAENKKILSALLKQVKVKKGEKKAGRKLAGTTFVLTGTLPTLAREEAAARIRAAGGTVSSSVSKKTSYVVAGEEAGLKLEKSEGTRGQNHRRKRPR